MTVVAVDQPSRSSGLDTRYGSAADRSTVIAVTVYGALGAAELPDFQRVFDEARARRPARIVIDLVHADFLSLQAAAYLGGAESRARQAGVALEFVLGESRGVRRALEATGAAPARRQP